MLFRSDTNLVQDVLFRAVSDGKNLFVVGDVKQSIYRFRLADPSIFTARLNEYQTKGTGECIMLSNNFRSNSSVLDAANLVFSKIMTPELGGVLYDRSQFLTTDKPTPHPNTITELDLLDVESEDKSIITEARHVAARIAKLLDGHTIEENGQTRPAQPGDVVILLRSLNSRYHYFERELALLGIKAVSGKAQGHRDIEIDTFLALIYTIDNPLNDISLIALLRSPLFLFTADDLARISLNTGKYFYQKLCADAEENPQSAQFLDILSDLRQASLNMTVCRLLWHAYIKLDAFYIFSAMGKQCVTNLIDLFKKARDYENGAFRGLHGFGAYLEKFGLARITAQSDRDCVRIMSIHKSKGLEFPIVFLPDCTKRYNADDLKSPVLIDNKLKIGMHYRDYGKKAQYPTLPRLAIATAIERENRSEEIRVLYVAMTRAREKLIMSGSRQESGQSEYLPGIGNYTKLIVHAAQNSDIIKINYVEQAAEHQPAQSLAAGHIEAATAALPDEFEYPHAQATALPSKTTATQLKGRQIDREVEPPIPKYTRRPQGAMTAAERGTAMHLAMQFIDFSKCGTAQGIKQEIARLTEEKFLTVQQGDNVEPDKIAAFFDTELGKNLLGAQEVRREFKFLLLVDPPQVFDTDYTGDKVMLQGIIDCWFETPEGVWLLDFKTDNIAPGYAQQAAQKYKPQLESYALALSRITKKPVAKRLLYFFHAKECVEV